MKRYTIVCAIMMFAVFSIHIATAGTLVDNGNGTISDQGTHLMWQKQDDGTTRIWTVAITYCEGLSLAGYTDWRLPTMKELMSIEDKTKINPAINSMYFTNPQTNYWSSTTYTTDTTSAWLVDFSNGYTNHYGKTGGYYVRCVR